MMKACFVHKIQHSEIIFKYAKGASEKSGKEFHPYHEILLFMGGEAEFISEQIQTTLQPNTLIVIPKESYHQFVITGKQEDYLRCVFNFYEPSDLKFLIAQQMKEVFLTDMTEGLSYLFYKTRQLAEAEESAQTKHLLLHSLLSLLLTELTPNHAFHNKKSADALSAQVISYLSDHLCDALTIERIAKKLNVSPSTLSHTFKKEMNISLYRYILEKRLILAQQKIANGEAAAQAALECGFHDYSGFYKQYKKMFSVPPSSKNPFFPSSS